MSYTIHVRTAGTLSSLISAENKYTITDLTISGLLNGTDIKFIREMAGGGFEFDESTKGRLGILNLAAASIVSGGLKYFCYGDKEFNDNSIGGCFFAECGGLKEIILPNNVTKIGTAAFLGCEGLNSIKIPKSVTYIGEKAFMGCSRLADITIPNSVKTIEWWAFAM